MTKTPAMCDTTLVQEAPGEWGWKCATCGAIETGCGDILDACDQARMHEEASGRFDRFAEMTPTDKLVTYNEADEAQSAELEARLVPWSRRP